MIPTNGLHTKTNEPTYEELKERVAQLESRLQGGSLECRIGEKGGVSVYGLGKYPVTLYYGQWVKLFEHSHVIYSYLRENLQKLKVRKTDKLPDEIPGFKVLKQMNGFPNLSAYNLGLERPRTMFCPVCNGHYSNFKFEQSVWTPLTFAFTFEGLCGHVWSIIFQQENGSTLVHTKVLERDIAKKEEHKTEAQKIKERFKASLKNVR